VLVPPCDSPPPRAEVSRECGPGELMRRVKRLEDALSTAAESRAAEMETVRMEVDRQFAKLRKQLRDQEDRISELESSNAKLKASCTTVDAVSQTDPTPSQEYEVPTAARRMPAAMLRATILKPRTTLRMKTRLVCCHIPSQRGNESRGRIEVEVLGLEQKLLQRWLFWRLKLPPQPYLRRTPPFL